MLKKSSLLAAVMCIMFYMQNAVAQKPDISVSLFRDMAFGAAWSMYDSTLVAFNSPQPNGYYAIYFANINAKNQRYNERCFTCGNALLPGKNVGTPDFQPTGKYIAMIVEKANHPGSSTSSTPGMGIFSDVWVMTMDGKKAYQLTNTPDTLHSASGVLFPFFSPDGKKLSWTEMTDTVNISRGKQAFGYWVIKTADFIDDNVKGPSLANIKVLQPGEVPAFNEAYGWSPDGSKIIFASDYNQFWVWDDQIYTMDTNGNNIKQMSSTFSNYPYCEHAFYSPNGKHIVWMTNRDAKTGSSKGGDDWWLMNADSTHQQRLTYFNDTTSSYWTGNTHINGHGSFSTDGKRFIGDVGGNLPLQVAPKQVGSIYVVNMSKVFASVADVNVPKQNCIIYPNPATTYVRVKLSDNVIKAHYTVYKLPGSKVAEGNSNSSMFNLDVSNYPAGVYLLKLSTGEKEINRKVVITVK